VRAEVDGGHGHRLCLRALAENTPCGRRCPLVRGRARSFDMVWEARMRRTFALVIVVAAVVAGCTKGSTAPPSSSPGGATGGAVKEGGTLKIAAFDGIDSLNPLVGVNDDSYSAYMYMYPYLVQYDASLNLAPDFATDWTHSSDNLTWTFNLHATGKWSDGQALTAEDVAWTFTTLLKYQNGPTGAAAGSISHMTTAV